MPPRRKFSSTLEQQTLLYQLVRRYHSAKQNGALSEFWPVLWDLWFLQWPMVPEMIERGLLPPECANYKLTGEQTALLKAEKMPRLDVSLFSQRIFSILIFSFK